ncbi:hypothetical protein DRO19_01230, partial [Candidatus Bathyarchaeota archaeon]
EAAGDTYNITAVKDGVEKNYARIFWKNSLNLYSNGSLVTWPGGPAGWEFSQINIASLWADAWDTPWFGAGKKLSLINEGPLFVEFEYRETYASDLFGMKFDYNVTTTALVRIYYQPDLNPLVRLEKTFNIQTNLANYTVKSPLYMDFKLANSTSQAIYQNFTWRNSAGILNCTSAEVAVTDIFWNQTGYGWWSYNGSRTDSSDKPAANIGLIPINCTGSMNDVDYELKVVQQLENDDHHCSQYINDAYNGTNGDYVKVSCFVVTYSLEANVETVMNNIASVLWSPLSYVIGEPFAIPEFPTIWSPLILIVAAVTILVVVVPAMLKHRKVNTKS